MTLTRIRGIAATFTVSIAAAVALAAPSSSSAMLIGVESNSEFTNSDRVPALQNPAIDKAQAAGAQVIRGNVNWSDIAVACNGQSLVQLSDHTNTCYNWNVVDNLVTRTKLRGVQLLFSVSRVPGWVHNNPDPMYVGATSDEFNKTVDNYTAFMTAIGTRYNASSSIGNVKMWTIWNEPNSETFWKPLATKAQQSAAPLRYAALYAKAAVALRATNSGAMIAPGPTGPASTIPPVTYITAFQKAATKFLPGTMTQKRSLVNAWAHNPYPYIFSARNRATKLKRLNVPNLPIQRTPELIKTLDKSPLTKGRMVWATEFGWETPPEPFPTLRVPTLLQGRYMAEGFDVLDATKRVTIAISYGLTDPLDTKDFQSGVYTSAGKAKPSLLWLQRPVSVSASAVKKGAKIQIYAKSNVKPKSTIVQYSYDGRVWKSLTGVKRRPDGSIRANVKVTRTTRFATFDGKRGPAIVVAAR